MSNADEERLRREEEAARERLRETQAEARETLKKAEELEQESVAESEPVAEEDRVRRPSVPSDGKQHGGDDERQRAEGHARSRQLPPPSGRAGTAGHEPEGDPEEPGSGRAEGGEREGDEGEPQQQ